MYKMFYTDKCADVHTDDAIRRVLREYFHLEHARVLRTENGKPYLENTPLFLSVSHTNDVLFLVFSSENVGLDVESLHRDVQFPPIAKKFHPAEREEIVSLKAFLRHWTAKEAAVKWLGGTLAKDLYKLDFIGGNMQYGEIALPTQFLFLERDGFLLCLCAEHAQDEPMQKIEKLVL